MFNHIVDYFLPEHIRNDRTHPKYDELRVILGGSLIGMPLMLLFPPVFYLMGKPYIGYLINDVLVISILFSIKWWGHYRIPMSTTAIVTYFIIYDWIKDSGLIYSSNVSIMHMYLLAAIWVDKKYGWYAIFSNLLVFGYIYYQTLHHPLPHDMDTTLGGPAYALALNCLITVFFGGFLAYLQIDQELDRLMIRNLQEQKITVLDEAVKKRTEQLGTIREAIATDFHDETGNMLSAITRQAALLKLRLNQEHEVQPIVETIIKNSNALYASSKDLLWHLNHNADDPQELFDYLTAYGQVYYNQFDIAFSSSGEECKLLQFEPMAALNVIFIFKEAMTNVVKHSGAAEVELMMTCLQHEITYTLSDNGVWKEPAQSEAHYGLANMERRCKRNGFLLALTNKAAGTQISVRVPVINLHV